MAQNARPDRDQMLDRAVDAALRLAARDGWARVRLEDVAGEAEMSLGALRRLTPDKTGLIVRFIAQADAAVLSEESGFRPEDSVRDRLFDLLMRRFDELDAHKSGVEAVFQDVLRDPLALMVVAPAGVRALGWYLEAAGVGADGPLGALRVKGLAAVWLHALRAWFEDDSEDLAKTMKALDRALGQAESVAGWLEGRRPDPRGADPDRPGDPEGEADAGPASDPGTDPSDEAAPSAR
ncbi:MAG: TetR family transcriptional regulator [Marivibrio sp.]|uniref:TetR family transcriptional regulator n=1 Tax=Marivibrio sp. TaxID=2039719 RepID=UPI0032EEF319